MDRHESKAQQNIDNQMSEAGVLGRALARVGNFLSDNKNKLAATTTAAVLTITLAGCGVNATEGGPKPETSRSDTPSPEATETSSPDYREPKEYTDEELISLENKPLPEALAPYAAMSVLDFEKLPIEERLTYCSYLNRDQDYLENEFYKGSGDIKNLLPDTFTKESTAQDIIGASGIYSGASFVSHFGGLVYDRDTSQKILSCGWFAPSSENPSQTYKFWTDARNEATVIGTPVIVSKNGSLKQGTATGEKPSTTVTTPDGKEYFGRTVSHNDSQGNSFEQTYVLVDYTDYKGDSKSVYINYGDTVS